MDPHLTEFALTRRSRALVDLPPSACRQLQALHGRLTRFPAGERYAVEGSLVVRPAIIVQGWMLRTRTLSDGRRQVLAILVPGDQVDFGALSEAVATSDVECATEVTIADGSALAQHVRTHRDEDPVVQAVRANHALNEALAMNAFDRLTRQTGYERMAHLFMDLRFRLALVGLGDGQAFPLPLTLQVIAELLSLSVVQASRVLSQMRREGLVERDKRVLRLHDVPRLGRRVHYCAPRVRSGANGHDPLAAFLDLTLAPGTDDARPMAPTHRRISTEA